MIMKTRHFIYLSLLILTIVSIIFSLDYRKKYLEMNSQYEALKSQLNKEVKYQQDLKSYSIKMKEAYDKLFQNYSSTLKGLEEIKVSKESQKETPPVIRNISSESTSKDSKKINRLLSLLERSKSQIDSLQKKLEEMQNQSQIESLHEKIKEIQNKCSQPVVKIIEKTIVERQPASTSQNKTKEVKNKPVDKFF